MSKLMQIVPIEGFRLFGAMVKKEIQLYRKNQGTFFRSAAKEKNKAKWSHKKFNGWIKLQRSEGEVVVAVFLTKSQGEDDWQLFHAFLGWVDRHFGDKVTAINIQYNQ
jgi:hypothetical protein